MDGGKLADSVVDLTGGISETIDIKDKSQIPLDIYEILWRSWKMNSFLGCSIPVCRHGFRGSRMMIFPFSIISVYDVVLYCIVVCLQLPANMAVSSREVRRPNGLYMGHAYSITALAVVGYI